MRRPLLRRLIRAPLIACAVALAGVPAAPPAHAVGLCGTLADELTAERAGLEREWLLALPIDVTAGGLTHLIIDEEVIIAQSADGGVHAIHTGEVTPDGRCNPQIIWSIHVGSPGQPILPASVGPELVTLASGNDLYAIEKSTGQIRWREALGQAPIAGGATVGEWVYQPEGAATVRRVPSNPWRDSGVGPTSVTSRTGSRTAGRPGAKPAAIPAARKAGAPLSSAEKRARMDATENLKPLSLNAGGTLERDMIPFGTGTLWTTRAGTIVALEQGDRGWQRNEFQLDSQQAGPLATRGSAIFATTRNRDLARIDSLQKGSDLRLAWRVLLDGPPEEDGPFVAGDKVIVSLGEDGLRCYSTETGDLIWSNCVPGQILAVAAERIWILDRVARLTSLDLATGEPRQQFCLGPFTRPVVNRNTDRLILATQEGGLVSLAARGAGAPKSWTNLEPLPKPEAQAAPSRPAPQPNPPEHLRGNAFDDEPAAAADTPDEDAPTMDDGDEPDLDEAEEPAGDGEAAEDPFEARDS